MSIRGGCFDPVEVEAYIQSLVPEATGGAGMTVGANTGGAGGAGGVGAVYVFTS